jgi:hypothetical protein
MNPLEELIAPDTNLYQGLPVPDIMMCLTTTCTKSKSCRRHTDSGTIPTPDYQSQCEFDPKQCNAYWPIVKAKPE